MLIYYIPKQVKILINDNEWSYSKKKLISMINKKVQLKSKKDKYLLFNTITLYKRIHTEKSTIFIVNCMEISINYKYLLFKELSTYELVQEI